MSSELLEIEPGELKFFFELKKQSSCSIQLRNKSDQYVAFKVKTTSPKKYCVRPNIGVINPMERCDFTVTMQAQHLAPPDLQCKDKFLIQSTIVPFGTTEEGITSNMFAKDSGKCIEEKKMKVLLVSPPPSPVLLPVNGEVNQEACNETQPLKDRVLHGVENIPPPLRAQEDVKGLQSARILDAKDVVSQQAESFVHNLMPAEVSYGSDTEKDAKKVESVMPDIVSTKSDLISDALKMDNLITDKIKVSMGSDLAKDAAELKSKLSWTESKLQEAQLAIKTLTEERSMSTQEKDILKRELEILKRNNHARTVQVGFPLLFVCMVALISTAIGYYIHP